MTGRSPNATLPAPAKIVGFAKPFQNKCPDGQYHISEGPLTNLDSLKTGNEDMINRVTWQKQDTSCGCDDPEVSLGACHKKDRNNDGKVDRQSNNANQ
jgi:hypothetical protein